VFEPGRPLGLEDWGAFVLKPGGAGRTRLIARGGVPRGARAAAFGLVLESPRFLMGREQLRLDEPPDRLPRRIDAAFDDALGRGLNALWSSHTPVAADADSFGVAMSIERAWEEHFKDRPVVTLCPYVVGRLDAPAGLERLSRLGAGHDGVLVPSERGLDLFRPS
jgi:hypothetical protein